MKALKFTLSGRTAFFKKPDVNTYVYFTYGNIHKIALLGIIGAILGLDGYSNQCGKTYPSFYEELNKLRIAVIQKNNRGYTHKKIQVFNNSVGYASQEQGGNLIVKEQWLENPKWDIYIMEDDKCYGEEIKSRLLNQSFVYIPYLGTNDHFANINQVEEIEIYETTNKNNIDSLFLKNKFEFIEEKLIDSKINFDRKPKWKYEEKLPIALDSVINQYIVESFIFTNMKVRLKKNYPLYMFEDKVLFFF